MDRYRYRYGTVEYLLVLFFFHRQSTDVTFVPTHQDLKNIFYVIDADFLDVPVVYNFLILNVGPPLGLIKYKKEI
jgi:hypothetical protein